MDEPESAPSFGMGRGKVFPASSAASLVNPLRRLVQSPRRTARATGARPGDRVLEVGCGAGYFSAELRAASDGGLFVALDLQPEMLAFARGRARDGRPGSYVASDAMALPFSSSVFDVVLVATMLGEVPDPQRAVHEVARVLRPGGTAAFAETRRDSDFLPLADLRRLVEPVGLALTARHGWAWQYVATFATEAAGQDGGGAGRPKSQP